MIDLQRVLDDLRYGELNQLGLLLNETRNNVSYDKQAIKQIVSHLNIALTELYSRFSLVQHTIVLQQFESITTYMLHSDFAKSNTASTHVKYIIDTPDAPFEDDVIRIESAWTETGLPIPINEPNKPNSIFTPDYMSVQIPNPSDENSIQLVYRAGHAPVTYTGDTEAKDIMIDVPQYLYEALLVYIAYRVLKSRNNPTSTQEAATKLAVFENLCKNVETRNMTNTDDVYETSVFEQGGWV